MVAREHQAKRSKNMYQLKVLQPPHEAGKTDAECGHKPYPHYTAMNIAGDVQIVDKRYLSEKEVNSYMKGYRDGYK